MTVVLKFVTPSHSTAALGKLLPIHKYDLRRYVTAYPLAWISA